MSNLPTPPDAAQRELAIDPTAHVIVRAPAGSGKTTLLVQRYLALLGRAENPESVLAITFTRKAAAEMRSRVLGALRDPDNTFADAARAADTAHNWQLPSNPARLKIQTIDSFAMVLAQNLPLPSRYLTGARLTEQPESLYEQAVDELFEQLYLSSPQQPAPSALVNFLQLMDGDMNRARTQIVNMLAQRDIWIVPVTLFARAYQESANNVHQFIQDGLGELVEWIINAAEETIPQALQAKLLEFSAQLGSAQATNADLWEQAGSLMTTGKGDLRKVFAKTLGFDAEQRKELKALSAELASAGAQDTFRFLNVMPKPAVSQDTSHDLMTVASVLSLSVIQLEQVFRREQRADFSEVLIAASRALEDPNGPTDLALALDYRINHLLVDEFQDTSHSQYRLLELLMAGWDASDTQRSFFAVGDPQQSIYRFRGAEVSLFLNAFAQGIGGLPLTQVVLRANFRSQAKLVDFSNDRFAQIFGSLTQPVFGRVAHEQALPQVAAHGEHSATYTPCPGILAQAHAIADLVSQLGTDHPQDSIALLVRARGDLKTILPVLRARGLSWQAQDIEYLDSVAVVSDLLVLLAVLYDSVNRLAWFALLRSPLVGLTERDLLAIANLISSAEQGSGLSLLELLAPISNAAPAATTLSREGATALKRVHDQLHHFLPLRFEISARECVELLWIHLGGAVVYPDDHHHAQTFFELLDTLGPDARTPSVVAQRVAKLAASSQEESQLQVMTMHKAKGLEFDHVILPHLEKAPKGSEAKLIHWRTQNDRLLIGHRDGGELYDWLKFEEKLRNHAEVDRLFYVACTRAKQSLSLFADDSELGDSGAKTNSFLGRLQRACGAEDATPQALGLPTLALPTLAVPDLGLPTAPLQTPAAIPETTDLTKERYRLRPEFTFVAANHVTNSTAGLTAVTPTSSLDDARDQEQNDADNPSLALIGSLIHEALQELTDHQRWTTIPTYLTERRDYWLASATKAHISKADAELVIDRISAELTTLSHNDACQWICAPWPDGGCEIPLSAVVDDELVNIVIDRMFVDDTGVRWIIDYKTAIPHGSMEQFVERQRRLHKAQLALYCKLAQELYTQPVRGALFLTQPGHLEPLTS